LGEPSSGGVGACRRAIDLVCDKGPNHFQLIELKVASDNPLAAAVQIISYVSVWLLTRNHDALNASPILKANRLDAVVLAPDAYYARYSLKGIEARLNSEIGALGREHGLELSFEFQAFFEASQAPRWQMLALQCFSIAGGV
jgi:hypothetical protein